MKSNQSISRTFFWANSVFCNFKNGQKSIFELGKKFKSARNVISPKNWFIWFHEFSCLDFFKFSGPLCAASRPVSKLLAIIFSTIFSSTPDATIYITENAAIYYSKAKKCTPWSNLETKSCIKSFWKKSDYFGLFPGFQVFEFITIA